MITCTKRYIDFPFAHRQHNHKGHCRLLHGHNWSFEFVFACKEQDKNGFVIDFGKMKWLKDWLTKHFDHTLLLNRDDPALIFLLSSLTDGTDTEGTKANKAIYADVVLVDNASCEGLAKWIFDATVFGMTGSAGDRMEPEDQARGVYLLSVTVFEDSKNSATYTK